MIKLVSFGFKFGAVKEQCLAVFDCRMLPNPHNFDHLRALTGTHPDVQDFLMQFPATVRMLTAARELAAGEKEGTIAFGCYGGRHRSVAMVERLTPILEGDFGLVVVKEHRELVHKSAQT